MATILNNHYILILCGGSGPRLWPLSRAYKPKQFLKLLSNDSLLKETFLRAQKIVSPDHIFVIGHQKYFSLIKEDLKGLVLDHNIISEPEKKNTALAILYGTAIISQINPAAIITTFTSDHFISNLPAFIKTIRNTATLAAAHPSIVTIGISPTSPNTSFGYLLVRQKQNNFFNVKNFIEKPPLSTAEKLIRSGHSFWNSGMYTFTSQTLFSQFKLHAPKYFSLYQQLLKSPHNIPKIYTDSPNLPIDIAISEKSKDIIMIPADFIWNDVGEWKSIYQQLSQKQDDIVPLNRQTDFIQIGSRKCLVSGPPNKLIGLVNVDNLAVIDTPDALLVCNITNGGSFKVRDLVAEIIANPKLKKYFLSKNDQ
jgi:mannose-1-phosphate guanylyltransferase/mannose-6-phosphate isomerase